MPFVYLDQLKYYYFDSLADEPLIQAVFTRQGGVSPAPWTALNLGGTVGDDADRVIENRRRAFQALGVDASSVYDAWQVHSDTVVVTDRPRPPAQRHLEADAILTDTPGVTLFMRFADCVPIFLYEPRRRVIGLVHAGWKGVVNQVARRAVETMQQQFGVDPADILAGLGPSIAPHHYEVGQEVVDQIQAVYGATASMNGAGLLQQPEVAGGGLKLDLWKANQLALEQAGVRQVEISGICTACALQDWYSHRAEQGKTGRFGAMIALKP